MNLCDYGVQEGDALFPESQTSDLTLVRLCLCNLAGNACNVTMSHLGNWNWKSPQHFCHAVSLAAGTRVTPCGFSSRSQQKSLQVPDCSLTFSRHFFLSHHFSLTSLDDRNFILLFSRTQMMREINPNLCSYFQFSRTSPDTGGWR